MEMRSGWWALAAVTVFALAAAVGAGANLLYTSVGSSPLSQGLLAGGMVALGWYGYRARRRWNEKRPSTTQRSKLQAMEERWKAERTSDDSDAPTSECQPPPSSKERSE